MKKYLKLTTIILSLVFLINIGTASADGLNVNLPFRLDIFSSSLVGDACKGLSQAAITGNGCKQGGNTVKSIAHTVINVMSIIVGVISIIMLIVAGLKFITSSGDSNAVASAKNTLIYAIVGLFIAVLAQLLVHFVLSSANSIQNSSYLNNSHSLNHDS